MKYSTEMTIHLPRERVIELFDNQENLFKWQPGLKSFEHLSGEPGMPGAKSSMVFDQNGRRIEMVETIVTRNFPDEFSAIYEAKGVWNLSIHRFREEGPEKTHWVNENEFKLSGLMSLMGLFMRGAFPKQSLEYMQHFKTYAEGEGV